MIIERRNLNCKVVNPTVEEVAWLRRYLVFENTAAKFGGGSPTISMFNPEHKVFPAGLIAPLTKRATQEGLQVTVIDQRVHPLPGHAVPALPSWLYPYQKEAVTKAVLAENGIIWASTGAGKSVIMSALVQAVPLKTVLLTHRTTLLRQLAASYEKFTGKKAGVIGEGQWSPNERFTVAMIPTLARKIKIPAARAFLSDVRMIILDEAHVGGSDSVTNILKIMPDAYYRIGLSATPLARGDSKSIMVVGMFGPICYRIHTRDLINQGYLAEPTVRCIEVQQEYHGVESTNKWYYQKMYHEAVVHSALRNRALLWAMKSADAPGFTFVTNKDHGKNLLQMASTIGLGCRYVDGDSPTSERVSAVEGLLRGDYKHIITTKIFQEGLDVPALKSVVLGGAGKSWIGQLQMVGRGARITPTKKTFEVWDIFDQGIPMLYRHAKSRIRSLQDETFTVQVGTLAEFHNQLKTKW